MESGENNENEEGAVTEWFCSATAPFFKNAVFSAKSFLMDGEGAVKLTSPIFQEKISICARKFPKGDAPNGRRKRSESPLVGRWGKAPYLKILRYLFLEMFGLILTASLHSDSTWDEVDRRKTP